MPSCLFSRSFLSNGLALFSSLELNNIMVDFANAANSAENTAWQSPVTRTDPFVPNRMSPNYESKLCLAAAVLGSGAAPPPNPPRSSATARLSSPPGPGGSSSLWPLRHFNLPGDDPPGSGTHSQIARARRRRHALPNGMNWRRCRARHAEFRFRVGRRRRFNSPGGSPPGGMQQAGLYPNPAVASHSATCPAAAYPSLHLSESSPSTSQTQYSQCIWPKLNALPPSRDQQKLNTPFQWRILSHV